MNIIAQRNGFVNINVHPANARPEWTGEDGKRWEEKKTAAKAMAQKMERAGFKERAARMSECGALLQGTYCPSCGRMHIEKTWLCRDRLCPVCQWRLALKRYANMVEIMRGLGTAFPEAKWTFVTLTAQNCSSAALGATIDEMCRAWNSIASRKTFKGRIVGWARALEITYNATTHTVHPHFHILCMWAEGAEPEVDYLPEAWMGCTTLKTARIAQDAQVITPQDDNGTGAVLETYKYSVKSSDLFEMPLSHFKEAANALKGRRLVAFGGVVKEYARKCELDNMDDLPDEEEAGTGCIRCGSTELERVCAEWAGTGYEWWRGRR